MLMACSPVGRWISRGENVRSQTRSTRWLTAACVFRWRLREQQLGGQSVGGVHPNLSSSPICTGATGRCCERERRQSCERKLRLKGLDEKNSLGFFLLFSLTSVFHLYTFDPGHKSSRIEFRVEIGWIFQLQDPSKSGFISENEC